MLRVSDLREFTKDLTILQRLRHARRQVHFLYYSRCSDLLFFFADRVVTVTEDKEYNTRASIWNVHLCMYRQLLLKNIDSFNITGRDLRPNDLRQLLAEIPCVTGVLQADENHGCVHGNRHDYRQPNSGYDSPLDESAKLEAVDRVIEDHQSKRPECERREAQSEHWHIVQEQRVTSDVICTIIHKLFIVTQGRGKSPGFTVRVFEALGGASLIQEEVEVPRYRSSMLTCTPVPARRAPIQVHCLGHWGNVRRGQPFFCWGLMHHSSSLRSVHDIASHIVPQHILPIRPRSFSTHALMPPTIPSGTSTSVARQQRRPHSLQCNTYHFRFHLIHASRHHVLPQNKGRQAEPMCAFSPYMTWRHLMPSTFKVSGRPGPPVHRGRGGELQSTYVAHGFRACCTFGALIIFQGVSS